MMTSRPQLKSYFDNVSWERFDSSFFLTVILCVESEALKILPRLGFLYLKSWFFANFEEILKNDVTFLLLLRLYK